MSPTRFSVSYCNKVAQSSLIFFPLRTSILLEFVLNKSLCAPRMRQRFNLTLVFFRPHPDKLLHKYAIHPELDENTSNIPHLKYIRTLQDFVDDALTEHSPEFAPVVARAEYEFFQRDAPFTDCPDGVSPYAWDEFDPASHSLWVTFDMFNHLHVQRQGSFDGFNLEYIRLQRQIDWP